MNKKIGIALFIIILLVLPIITLITNPKEKKPFSENENRYLEEFPEVSFEAIKNEDFMTGFDSWFADRFAGRETWISAKNNMEQALGKTEIDTVFTKNDQMIQVLSAYDDIGSSYDSSVVDRNTAVINSFAENHPNTEVYFMLCPTSIGIYGEKLLPSAVLNMSIDEKEMIDYCYGNQANVTGIDVYTALADASDEYIYYRTDHHWTSLGAFKAYTAAADYLGYTPYALEDFDVESINNSFQGTLFSKTLDQSVTKDSIDLYTLKNAGFTLTETTSNGVTEESYDSIFFKEYLEVKDKYSTYTGSNVAVCTITKNGADAADADSSLLIIKDSYANSMIQFLANNYDCVTMIDMRYTNMPLSALVNVEDYNQVLFLYNCITFADDSDLMKINLGE